MNEIDELERSNTKRFIFGIGGFLLVAAAIGLALRSKGTGAPEDDHKILIVQDQTYGLESYAADLGFEALSGSMPAWQDEVAQNDKGKLASVDVHLEQLLAFADRFGYGYVVLEQPQRFADELDELKIERPAGFDTATFAVVSVGDFAGPHVLSVDAANEQVELGVGPRMLTALFAQPRLSDACDPKTASSELQTVRLALDDALTAIDLIERQAQRGAELRAHVQAKLDGFARVDGSAKAQSLQAPLEGASVYPLADGRVIVRSDGLTPIIRDTSLTLRGTSSYAMRVIPADAPAQADARQDCPELLDGGGRRGSIVRMELSRERDTLFVLDRGGLGSLFELDPSAGPCGLRSLGELSLPERDNSYVAVGQRIVGIRDVDEDGALTVAAYSTDPDRPMLELSVREPEFSSAASLVWLDGQRLVTLAQPRDSEVSALVFVDAGQPERPWVLTLSDPAAPERSVYASELQRIPGAAPALLLRWQDGDDYVLSRLDFPRPWAELLADEGDDTPMLAPTWTIVARVGSHMRGYDVDLSAHRVAYTVDGDAGVDVAMVGLPDPGEPAQPPTMLIQDAFEHREVSFRPGHDELLFRTRVRLEEFDASMMVAHALPL